MARRRFFADSLGDGEATVASAHLARVLRAEVGQRYELARDGRVYLGEVVSVGNGGVRLRLIEELPQPPAAAAMTLAAALFKFDRFEWMLEKATELGVASIQILATRRTDAHLLAAAPKRLARWQTIVREASEQSRRATMPEILAPLALDKFLRQAAPGLLLSEDAAAPALAPASGAALLLTGPEGGWAPEEFTAIQAAGHLPASLGPRILRCETAILAAVARLAPVGG